ncbi:NAD(P)/FAD-dependent oxidoreductase [Ottowia flava]|uniref:NAD(P)/FAD-dependent oxidoreductase n=1 Tax=Ottowia flava TaxID=2675430 RepID=A0ABW4KW98_9BURK
MPSALSDALAPTLQAAHPLPDTAITPQVAVIGAGPAGLMAAEVLGRAGVAVDVFDAMPSVGRKFLLAGRGGLNLTHAEPLDAFVTRYGEQAGAVADWLRDFGPQATRDWAAGLGIDTFVGTSGRVFPTEMKAAPLLRAWLHRLRQPAAPGAAPVRFHMRQRWVGWAPADAQNAIDSVAGRVDGSRAAGQFLLKTPAEDRVIAPRIAVLALGGGSWPRLGSDGAWLPWLADAGVDLAPLQAANCGFDVAGRETAEAADQRAAADGGWTPYFAERFAGQPLKNVVIDFTDSQGRRFTRRGEFVLTATGVEGSLVYAASALLRGEIARSGHATFRLNLLPARKPDEVRAAVAHPRGSRSLSSHLKSRLGLQPVHTALLHELLTAAELKDPAALATALQALPITLRAPRPMAEAISTAGGVRLNALTPDLELRARPGIFCAGEMLDWEAPTGGYLLTACLASGVRVAQGVLRTLDLVKK